VLEFGCALFAHSAAGENMSSTKQPKTTVIQQPKTDIKRRDDRAAKPVGQPLEPALLKQVGGGSSIPVGRW
jgi:hypothetical protein